jgi:thiol:disulfide interchange protein DsbD
VSISLFDRLNDWVGAQLAASSGAESFAFLFVGGLLASLLPCVYPLYPITVSILRGRQSALGRYAHPLAYYVGLSGVYFSFGIIAALTGGAFNEVLRLPAANLTIGAVLFALGLATVGYLHFPTISTDFQPRDRGLPGSIVMGGLAGLLSSACVGPVVVSILVGLAANAEAVTIGTTLLASVKMLAFGLGVGFPILLIGVLGVSLPRGGRWMVAVQWIFGALIAYFALGYVYKGLGGVGVRNAAAHAVVFGAALLLGATFLLQRAEAPKTERMRNALLALAAATGFLVMARAVVPTSMAGMSMVPGVVAASAQEALVEERASLTWYLDRDAAYATAKKSGKPVFIDFYGDWCANCKAFEALAESDPVLRAALTDAVLLKVYDTSPLFRRYRDDARFPELRVGLPFFLITNPEGDVLYKTSDFTKTDEMVLFLSS